MMELLERRRTAAYLVAFLVEIAIFFIAISYPVPSNRLPELQQEARNITSYAQTSGGFGLVGIIFGNNIRVALLEMIPVYGIIVFAGVMFETGQVLQVASYSTGVPGLIVGMALFLFPFAFVELFSYAIAVASGNMLVFSALRGRLRKEIRVYVLEAISVVLLLFLAASMETLTIMDWRIGLVLWLPVIMAIVWLAIYRSRMHKTFI